MRYNEAVYDKSTGLYYLSARYYDPEDGRFLTRDSYRGDVSNPSTLHLYVYCANNPVNYKDPSGHIAISSIVGGIIGGAAGAWVGTKIAKKTKAKGWKKVAIIAGCTIGGAVIGAIAGPKVAKVAKKAASYVKRKLPSKTTNLRKTKNTIKKPKSGSLKKAPKSKQVFQKKKITRSYKSKGRMSDDLLLRKNTNTKHAQNLTEWRRTIKKSNISTERIKFVGEDAVKVDKGTWRSIDGMRQFRVTPRDYQGLHGIGDPIVKNIPHVHFEFLEVPSPGGMNLRVLRNIHVPLIN